MAIEIKIIPHIEQRYPTCGDYWEDAEGTHFRISAMDDLRYEYLVIIHEIVEYFMVKLEGIPLSVIDDFDKQFEADRVDGNTDEPGDDKKSPYFFAHQLATMVERMVAFFMGVYWKEYESAVESLV